MQKTWKRILALLLALMFCLSALPFSGFAVEGPPDDTVITEARPSEAPAESSQPDPSAGPDPAPQPSPEATSSPEPEGTEPPVPEDIPPSPAEPLASPEPPVEPRLPPTLHPAQS